MCILIICAQLFSMGTFEETPPPRIKVAFSSRPKTLLGKLTYWLLRGPLQNQRQVFSFKIEPDEGFPLVRFWVTLSFLYPERNEEDTYDRYIEVTIGEEIPRYNVSKSFDKVGSVQMKLIFEGIPEETQIVVEEGEKGVRRLLEADDLVLPRGNEVSTWFIVHPTWEAAIPLVAIPLILGLIAQVVNLFLILLR